MCHRDYYLRHNYHRSSLDSSFEALEPDPLNDETFRVMVAQPMDETPGRPLSPFAEADGSVVGAVIAHVMDEYTVEMPPPPPLPQFLLVTITPLPLPPIPDLRTPSPQRCSPGVRPTTRSHSTCEKADCRGI